MLTVSLTTPVTAHGDDVSSLTLREPTGKDIRVLGTPFRMVSNPNGGFDISFDSEAIAKYISALASIPPSSVDALSAADFMTLIGKISGFFGQGAGS